MSPDKDPARKRRIRSKAARLRRRSAPGAAADDRPPPAGARPATAPVPTTAGRPPAAEPGGATAGRPPDVSVPATAETGAGGGATTPATGAGGSATAARTDAGGGAAQSPPSPVRGAAAGPPPSPVRGAAAGLPPLPVRGAVPGPVNAGEGAPDDPAVPPPFPPLSLLSAEELLADQPSVDMLRRVRRGLRALPESDGHLSD
ncbi:hypothetical protein [Streptomyces stelliscabiei]|uniref:Uncharacterized protein n=1 Tax=Streptomyces stelliscabiei TaxID=146820 RepID=A0A8I0TTW8_9ACTN|nr:hypothetical protein [Streptomyces stelliscabiei]MBE1600154.1 hypothetical protein [Streptomyces stelliscabiei]MDX2515684.1 hypothetical protein [Streptomyces stelliscabiei]